jgi:hypothetical protein
VYRVSRGLRVLEENSKEMFAVISVQIAVDTETEVK